MIFMDSVLADTQSLDVTIALDFWITYYKEITKILANSAAQT